MKRLVAAMGTLAVLLSACSGGGGGRQAPPASVPSALVAQREAAGLPDCPVTDPHATAVPGGLPAVTLGCLGSTRAVNLAGLRGKPMVVNVWAQWCGPCRAEAPHLRDYAARAGDRVMVLGVDFDDPKPDWAIEFASLAGWRYPHVTDPGKLTASAFKVQGIPMTLFVDAQGRIVHRFSGGFSSTEQIVDLTRTYLGVSL